MSMKSFQCPDSRWQKAKEKIEKSKYDSLSDFLRKSLRDFVGDDENKEVKERLHIVERSGLSDKQKRLVRKLVSESVQDISLGSLLDFSKRHNVYTRSDYVKNAVKRIDRSNIPYNVSGNSKLEDSKLKCKCGAEFFFHVLGSWDGVCKACGRVYVKFRDEQLDFEVIG